METDPRLWYNLQGTFQRVGNFLESLKGGRKGGRGGGGGEGVGVEK